MQVYQAFATYGSRYNGTSGLDGARFMKLTNDCGLTGRGRRLKATDVDLVFAQVRTRGARVITFEQVRLHRPIHLVSIANCHGGAFRQARMVCVRLYADR